MEAVVPVSVVIRVVSKLSLEDLSLVAQKNDVIIRVASTWQDVEERF